MFRNHRTAALLLAGLLLTLLPTAAMAETLVIDGGTVHPVSGDSFVGRVVIEDGRISEEGTHAELLERTDGTYKKLHEMQQELHEMYAV